MARHRARQQRPRLRDRIDLVLVVLRRSERPAVVVIPAAEPFAVPRRFEARRVVTRGVAIAARRGGIMTVIAQLPEVIQDLEEEEAEPRAFAAPFVADAIHAVVPVADADQWQAMRAVGDAAI